MVTTPEVFPMDERVELWMVGDMGDGMFEGPVRVTAWMRLHLDIEQETGRPPSVGPINPVWANCQIPFGKLLFASTKEECEKLVSDIRDKLST